MDIKSVVKDTVQKGLIKRIADDILQGIDKVKNKPDISSRRWLWEMMQNARDVPNKWGGVSIKVILDNDRIRFCHNGNPFSILNLTNLVMQVSSKDEDDTDNFVGKFGTGFLVTHLLSTKLNLKGNLLTSDNVAYQFNLDIDRSAQNSKELQDEIQTIISEIENINESKCFQKTDMFNSDEQKMETVFEYPLDEKTLIFAKNGIQDLINTLPLTLVFTAKIKNVSIQDNISNENYSFLKKDRSSSNRIIWEVTSKNMQDFFYLKSSDDVTLALKIKSPIDLTPQELSRNTPRLYRDFPLIGSEDFGLSYVIHSSSFFPNETRSSILLVDEQNVKVELNRQLLKKALKVSYSFIDDYQRQEAYHTNYLLAISNIPKSIEPEISDWYAINIRNVYRAYVLKNLIFQTKDNTKKYLENLKVPYFKSGNHQNNEEFYDVFSEFYVQEELPRFSELLNWQSVLDSDYHDWNYKILYSCEDLIAKLSGKSIAVDNLSAYIPKLNKLYGFLFKTGQTNIIQESRLVPNSDGVLMRLTDLKINDNIQDEFLNIISKQIPRYRETLVLKGIDTKIQHSVITSASLFKELTDIVKLISFSRFDEDDLNFVYRIMRLQYSEKENFRSVVFKSFCELFGFKEEIVIIVNENDSFDFSPVVNKTIEYIFKKIEISISILGLSEILKKDFEKTELWLSNLLEKVQESNTYKDSLSNFRIYPNYYGDFSNKQSIFNLDDNSNDSIMKLVDLHEKLLPKNELKNNLLHPNFNLILGQKKSLAEVSNDLDEKAKQIYHMWTDATDIEKKYILDLLEWSSLGGKNKDILESNFNWLSDNKAQILMKQFEKKEVKDAMFSILKADERKIVAFSKILGEKSTEDFEKMISVIDVISADQLDNIILMINDINELGTDKISRIIEEKKEERRDFVFKKSIGNTFEKVFLEFIHRQNLNYEIKKLEAPADFKISNGEKVFYVELKSYSRNSPDTKIRMSFNQAKGAKDFKDNYALCVLRRPDNWNTDSKTEVGYDYMVQNVKAVLDIGEKIESGFLKSIEFKESLLDSDINGVGVEFKDNDYKITIQPLIYNSNQNLQSLMELIISRLS